MENWESVVPLGPVVLLERGERVVDEQAVLERIRMLVDFLDNRFVVPGTGIRFGWDGVIGLIPGIGDVLTTAIAAYIVYLCRELGVPKHVQLRMVANVFVDLGVGAVPIVGDLLDVTWRANVKNLRLLERHLLKRQDAAKR
ncbi:DUF4112 domain-containing protein [Planctomicrobium sp. SH664]|uniref:DUF4112 domain-containing protein n=1 Tax=Planctomicrobium sp. SH664 TaxID=3448125 RepID=UPI003F5C5022